MSQQLTRYLDETPEEKIKRKLEKQKEKERKINHSQASYVNEWLGIVPFSLKIFFKR